MPQQFRTSFHADDTCRTQRHLAVQGVASAEMQRVAQREHLTTETVREEVARGRMVIPANVHHAALDPMADPKIRAAVARHSFEVLVGFQLTPEQLAYNATR